MSNSVSIICTTFNEEHTINTLLESLSTQTVKADEIIICDGSSQDSTQSLIKEYQEKHPNLKITLLSKKGNRSVGRNAAIEAAKTPLIAITDAGCLPEKNWLEELLKTYKESQAPVVAGFYKGLPTTAFEEAVVPYVLVMPDKVNPKEFLPATRSVLLEKKVWKEVGAFDERLTLNEDYAFAKKIQSAGIKIAFSRNAVVAWFPRKNISEFATMIARFAEGDIQANIIRPKVVFLFFRYAALVFLVLTMSFTNSGKEIVAFLLTLFVLYSGWAIQKNSRYVKNGWYWLPILQYVADLSVMKGSLKGFLNR